MFMYLFSREAARVHGGDHAKRHFREELSFLRSDGWLSLHLWMGGVCDVHTHLECADSIAQIVYEFRNGHIRNRTTRNQNNLEK